MMAESSFLAAKKAGYETAEMYFLMGQIKQAQLNYPQALFFYKKAFKKIPESDIENRDRILWTIKNTALAETLFFSKSKNLIQNLGSKINKISNEKNPIGSPTFDGLIYFSSNANYFYNQGRYFPGKDLDLFQGFIRWNEVDSLSNFETALKSDLDDFVFDISDDGQGLVYVQGQNRKEVFWRSYNPSDNELISQKSFMSVIGESKILNFDMFQDSIYIFSSDKLGGYGGYDLYFTVRTASGWLKPVNLGPRINTINDELDPFLNKQGDRIYFSSNRINGMGGFDVYFSDYSDIEKNWQKPKNMLHPLNSSRDDLGFRISPTQHSIAYMYSNRLTDNYGGFDIYRVILDQGNTNEIANKAPIFVSKHLDSNIMDPIYIETEEDIIIEDQPTDFMIDKDYPEESELEAETIDSSEILNKIDQEAYVRDSIATVERIAREAFVKDSIATVERIAEETAKEEEQRIARETYVRDSIATVERIAREAFVKDSIATVERLAEEAAKEEEQRIARETYVRDSIATVERIARETFVKDSIATVERLAEEAAKEEEQRIARETYVRDSIATVERIAREAFVKDSIATIERLAEEAAKEEERRIARETFVRDSIATVERIAGEAFVRDSIATVEQLVEEAAKEEERRIAREIFIRDSISVADKLSEREALRIKREAEVEKERKRLAEEKLIQDSLAILEQQEADALAEKHAISDEAWKSKLEAKPLDFETIILSLGNPDATVIQAQPEEVEQIIDILTPNPHAIVEIEGFYPKKGRSKVYDMYNSLLLANELKDALIDKDIDPKKLIIKGHGYRLSDNSLTITDDNQRRILVRILNRNKSGYIPNLSSLFSLQAKESNYYQKYAEKVGGLTFKVEAIKLRRMLANEAIDQYEDIILEQKGNEKNFAYMFGTYSSMNDAISMVDKLKGHNIKHPIIYPYLNGIRVSLEQAKFMEDLYPELKNYLRYLESE